ncbi:MAG: WS/DGAT/MGAT family O-acyltransferase [Euzebya sp.]
MPITDSLFLDAEGRERPMHVGGLQLFRPPPDAGPDFVGRMLQATIAQSDIDPRLRRRAVRMGAVGPWAWEEDVNLDLEYHVRHSALPHPGRVRELLALASRLHGTMLHRSRPLWEAHLIEGLEDGRFALFTKMHHALIDGMSGMKMLQDMLSDDPDERDMPPPLSPPQRPPRGERHSERGNPLRRVADLVGGTVAVTKGVGKAVLGSSEAALKTVWKSFGDQAVALPYQAPRSILNQPITGSRRFAAQSYSTARIAAVRKAQNATLNDVVMGMCAGALRRYLLDLDALPEAPLVACVPVSLRRPEDAGGGNSVGVVLCNLGTHLADPQKRFEMVRHSMEQGKISFQGLSQGGMILLSGLTFAPLALGPLFRFDALRKPPFNLIISNVPGPQRPMYYNGARLVGSYPLSIPTDGQAMNITVATNAGNLDVGITGCRRTLPHLQRLLDHLDESLSELEKL